jgi:hypothetical protein
MIKFARIQAGIVVEVIETDQPIKDLYHPDIVASCIEVTDDVAPGWTYTDGKLAAPVAPTVTAPTLEQIRAAMPALSPRQFWLAASRINITKADVLALVDAMKDKQAASDMRIEVTETVSFKRTNPAIDQLATLLKITPDQLDSLWTWAAGF